MGRKPRKQVFCPIWMVTMGDVMSLLATFFVMMLTFSTLQSDKLMDVMGFIKGALNISDDLRADAVPSDIRPRNTTVADTPQTPTGVRGKYAPQYVDASRASPVDLGSADIQQRYAAMRGRLRSLGFAEMITVQQLREGLAISIPVDALFEPGNARLQPQALDMLSAFASLAQGVDNEVRITLQTVGHEVEQSGSERDRAAWAVLLQRPQAIGDAMAGNFQIDSRRIAYGVALDCPITIAKIELMLINRVGVQQTTIEAFIRANLGAASP